MSKRALRFNDTADMPPTMRLLYEAQENARRTAVLATVCTNAGKDAQTTHQQLAVRTAETASGGTRAKRVNKYGNKITTVDGIRFDSKREAQYYRELLLRKAAGEVSYWLRQVPIHLPGGTRYVLDFLVFFVDQAKPPEYVDVKGRETATFRLKRREVQHHYPIRVVLA